MWIDLNPCWFWTLAVVYAVALTVFCNLDSVSAADWQDWTVAGQQEPRVLHEEHHLYPSLQRTVRQGEISIQLRVHSRISWSLCRGLNKPSICDVRKWHLINGSFSFHQCGNAESFNSYMQSLKRSVPDRNLQEFWDLLVQGTDTLKAWSSYPGELKLWCFKHLFAFLDALTLISSDEVDSSSISKQDATQVSYMTFTDFNQKSSPMKSLYWLCDVNNLV